MELKSKAVWRCTMLFSVLTMIAFFCMMERLFQLGVGFNNFGSAPGLQARGTPLFTTTNMSGLDLVPEVQWLLNHGAGPRIRDGLGRLAIQYAILSGAVRRLLRDQRRLLSSLEAGELGLTTV